MRQEKLDMISLKKSQLNIIQNISHLLIKLMMNSTIKTVEDVEKALQLPVLAAVPYYQD